MNDQVHIRSAEAAQLARALARQTGQTITDVILEALRQYRPKRRPSARLRQLPHWQRLLRKDRERGFAKPELTIESLYDEMTGLPK